MEKKYVFLSFLLFIWKKICIFNHSYGKKIYIPLTFSIACLHAWSIVLQYMAYPITTTFLHKATTNFTSTSTIPDMTICNLNPISSFRSQSNGTVVNVLNISEYIKLVRQCKDCSRQIGPLGMTLSELLLTTNAYYQNVGFRNSYLLGHELEHLLVTCHVDVFDGFASEFIPCKLLLTVTWTSYPSLFNCFTLNIRQKNHSGFIAGYKLVLHLDNYNPEHLRYLSSPYRFSDSLGAVIFPHRSGTKGWLEGNAILLHPGKDITLELKMRHIHRLGTPYGNCVENEFLKYNGRWKYTHLSCVHGCVQKAVMEVRAFNSLASETWVGVISKVQLSNIWLATATLVYTMRPSSCKYPSTHGISPNQSR